MPKREGGNPESWLHGWIAGHVLALDPWIEPGRAVSAAI